MKRQKKLTAALIAAAMLITSAGCAENSSTADKAPEAAAVLAYRGTEAVIDGIKGTLISFSFNNGRVYTVSAEYPDESSDDNTSVLWISSLAPDGSGFCTESSVTADSPTPIAFDSSGTPCIAFGEHGENGIEKITLKKIGEDCRFTDEQDISGIIPMLKDSGNYLSRIDFDGEGNIYTLFSNELGVSDSKGDPIFTAGCEEAYSMKFVKSSSGELYISKTNYSGAFDLLTIDTEQKQLENKNSYCVSEGWYTTNVLAQGYGGSDMYWCDMDCVYSYDIESNTAEKIFSLSDSGIPSSAVEYIFPDGSGGFIFAGYDLRSYQPVITAVSRKELPASEADRKEITAAGLFYDIGTDIEYQMAEFNRTSADLKISLTKFREPEEFSSDMLSGQLKDIIFSGSETDIGTEGFIEKGIFADMGEFIDSDNQLSRSDFLPNILNAFERDGKLYTFPDSFQIQTALGKKSVTGDVQSLTFEDIDRIAEGLPAGTELFPGNDKNNMLRYLMIISGSNFIDRTSKSCSFDSEEFVNILKFADKYGLPKVDDDYYSNFDLNGTFSGDSGVMLITYLSDFRDIYYYEHNMFMEDIAAAGIPCESGTGEAIVSGTIFSINSSSGNAEDSWKFIRTMLLPEYQDNISSFPVRTDSFEKKRNEAVSKKPNENENYFLVCFIGDMAFGIGSGKPFTIEKSDADRVADAVYAAKVPSFIDSSVTDIVLEEASAFFSGAETAEEAAKLIQNRVTIYLSE